MRISTCLITALAVGIALPGFGKQSAPTQAKPDAALQQAFAQAGANKAQIQFAWRKVPATQRTGMRFLIENMPESDLKSLSARYLLDNVALAYQAWQSAPWKTKIPEEIFLNDVLPYASLTEARDNARRMLREKSLPLIAGSKSPGEAAQLLNAKLFPLVKVRYSTERARPDQNVTQSIVSGKASCSGLSILLVGACRAVGVPARVVGTPLWANERGNHTWVEIWDDCWHFTGAAEPDEKGLDHTWFQHDAAQAKVDNPRYGIFAASFKRTGDAFPLVWAPESKEVNAVNVTARYADARAADAKPDAETVRVSIKILDENGKRLKARIAIVDPATTKNVFNGETKDETADLNDWLVFDATRDHKYSLITAINGHAIASEFDSGTEGRREITLDLRQLPAATAPKSVVLVPPIPTPPVPTPPTVTSLPTASTTALKTALSAYFTASPEEQARFTFAPDLDQLLLQNEAAVRRAAWEAFQQAPIHGDLKTDFEAKQVRFDKHLSAYTVKTVGTRPVGGWPLFIAMHGGGGAPKAVNDSQWKIMQSYYKDHPEVGGYQYIALRAPNDTWNGFYDDYVYPLVANLIKQFLLFSDADANKVFLIGYSHGGYGAFAIGPKMPDRFAAIHASAAAPTDGETSAKTLRNTVFSAWVGEKDTMYGRLERDTKFAELIKQLRGERTDIFPVTVEMWPGVSHPNLPDRDRIPALYNHVRNPVPRELTWEQTDGVIRDFFWLHCDAPAKKQELDATCRDNRVTVTATNTQSATVLLDSRLIDFQKPVILEVNGRTTKQKLTPSLRVMCETLMQRSDADLAFTARLNVTP